MGTKLRVVPQDMSLISSHIDPVSSIAWLGLLFLEETLQYPVWVNVMLALEQRRVSDCVRTGLMISPGGERHETLSRTYEVSRLKRYAWRVWISTRPFILGFQAS